MSAAEDLSSDLATRMSALGAAAREAAHRLAQTDAETKSAALRRMAEAVRNSGAAILDANAEDAAEGRARGLTGVLMDRLVLDDKRLDAIASGLEAIAELPDPVGTVLADWTRPNGLHIQRVRVPIGVIGIIYESRPNVTADAGGLCLKSGNAAILRGGSESYRSSAAIVAALHAGLAASGLPETAIQMVPTTDRAAVGMLLTMDDTVDLIVPRGGQSLIERVMRESRIPVFGHLQGLCHTYIHAQADSDMAISVAVNAKMRRPGICGATETILIDRAMARSLLPRLADALMEAGCALRGDLEAQTIDARIAPASEEDWRTEYLDAIVSIAVVDGIEAAIAHINGYGSHHTDSIITADATAAARFLAGVDSGIVLHNASTQFADGGEFGMGAEIGIATGKLHARGPVGAEQLTSYKYLVHGQGQTRP